MGTYYKYHTKTTATDVNGSYGLLL